MNKKLKWVDSWRDIPEAELIKGHVEKGQRSGLVGLNGEKAIYLVRGKATEATALHEQYHQMKKHPAKERDPKAYVLHELQAQMYAYNKLHQPTHIQSHLRAIYRDINSDMYSLSGVKALSCILSALRAVKAPPAWFKDYEKLSQEKKG